MLQHQTFLRCSRTTATIIIIASACLFILVGCASLFRSAGLTNEQAAQQTAELKAALENATDSVIADIQIGLAQGHDLKTIALTTGSAFLWKILAAAGASIGVVLNGLLARWLGTERKITTALITGIEKSDAKGTKESVQNAATAAGIEPQLHKRVLALT